MSSSEQDNSNQNMRIDPQRTKLLAENLGYVAQQVQKVGGGRKVRRAYQIHESVYQVLMKVRFA